jgi:hypothetical protein
LNGIIECKIKKVSAVATRLKTNSTLNGVCLVVVRRLAFASACLLKTRQFFVWAVLSLRKNYVGQILGQQSRKVNHFLVRREIVDVDFGTDAQIVLANLV